MAVIAPTGFKEKEPEVKAKAPEVFGPQQKGTAQLPVQLTEKKPSQTDVKPPPQAVAETPTVLSHVVTYASAVCNGIKKDPIGFAIDLTPVGDVKSIKQGVKKILEGSYKSGALEFGFGAVGLATTLLPPAKVAFTGAKVGIKVVEVAGEEVAKATVKAGVKAGVKVVKEAVEKISITLVSETGEKAAVTFTKEEALSQLKHYATLAANGNLNEYGMHAFNRLVEETKTVWPKVLDEAGIKEAAGVLAPVVPKAGGKAAEEAVKKTLVKRFAKGVSEEPVTKEVEKTVGEAVKKTGMKGEIKEIVEIDPFKAVGKQKPPYYTPSYLVRVEHEGKEFVFGFAKGGKGGVVEGVVQKIEDATVQLGISAGKGGKGAVTKTAEIEGETYTFVLMKEFGGLK